MTIATKLNQILLSKAAIKTAIENKGLDMSNVSFSNYNTEISKIGNVYHRPSFWPEMPEMSPDSNRVSYLIALFPDSPNTITVRTDGAVHDIDWGDGTSLESVPSGSQRTKTYNYENITEPLNPRGYKTIIVNIMASGPINNIVIYGTLSKPAPLLECKYAPSTSVAGVSASIDSYFLEIFTIVGAPKWSYGYFLNNKPALRLIDIDLSACTTANAHWRSTVYASSTIIWKQPFDYRACTSPTALVNTFNQINLSHQDIYIYAPTSPFSANGCFQSARVRKIAFDDMSLCSDVTNMFATCPSLQSLRLPGIKISLSIIGCDLDYNALKLLIGDLYQGVTSQTLTITNNPGASDIMTAIANGEITVPTGWSVVS